MNRTAFVMSSLLTFLGILMLAWTRAVRVLLPKLGYLVFKASGGSYSSGEYSVDLGGVKGIAIVCIIAGMVMSVILYGRGKREERRG